MHYIVVDLEWNQPMSFDSSVFRQVGDRLVFEMIQIGAVKVDDKYQVVDSISIPIRPQYYVKIHPRIRKMTQLGAKNWRMRRRSWTRWRSSRRGAARNTRC